MLKQYVKHTSLYQMARKAYWASKQHKKHLFKRARKATQSAFTPFYFSKLLKGIRYIQAAPIDELLNIEKLECIIANVGLTYDKRRLYGDDNRYMNYGPGLWQIPKQLAQALCFLSEFRIRSMLEIGTFNGWTTSIITAYLGRFNPDLAVTTVDPMSHFAYYKVLCEQLPITYLPGRTVEDIKQQKFDLCFIDGNHDYPFCKMDYELAGKYARICMFHDINDKFIGDENVPRLWREIRAAEKDFSCFYEYTYHSQNENIMGIGIRVRKP